MVRVWAFVILILVALGFAAWASDFVTMQGERTVYTVDCSNGSWQGNHCAGSISKTRVEISNCGARANPYRAGRRRTHEPDGIGLD